MHKNPRRIAVDTNVFLDIVSPEDLPEKLAQGPGRYFRRLFDPAFQVGERGHGADVGVGDVGGAGGAAGAAELVGEGKGEGFAGGTGGTATCVCMFCPPQSNIDRARARPQRARFQKSNTTAPAIHSSHFST